MPLVKHGDGQVLPENEQQKTAQQQTTATPEQQRALQEENEAADGPSGA